MMLISVRRMWPQDQAVENVINLRDSRTDPCAVPLGEAARVHVAALPGARDPDAFLFSRHAEGRARTASRPPAARSARTRSSVVCTSTTCATPPQVRLSMSGKGPRLVGRLLGHRRHQTTAPYAHLAAGHFVKNPTSVLDRPNIVPDISMRTVNGAIGMENVCVPADAAVRKELTGHVDDINLTSVFRRRYGRGWQRKLGAVLDVPETTVNGWFRSGKFPVLAKLAFGVLLSRAIRPARSWIPVRNGAGYAVCDTQGPIGRIVADNINSLDDAMLLAAAPQLYEASRDAFVVFDDARNDMEGWGELADKLGAGLDAATLGRSEGGEKEKEEN